MESINTSREDEDFNNLPPTGPDRESSAKFHQESAKNVAVISQSQNLEGSRAFKSIKTYKEDKQ